jgi:hypothetical protein
MKLTTYPEMNEAVVSMFAVSEDPAKQYAAQRMRELEAEVADLKVRYAALVEAVEEIHHACRVELDVGISSHWINRVSNPALAAVKERP